MRGRHYHIRAEVAEPDGRVRRFSVIGRFAQTLDALAKAGPAGITSQEVGGWAVRLSHYIFRLRRDHGLSIDMELEEHGGAFPGQHGRYRLLSRVRIVEPSAGRDVAA
jgi:hypothetical protein